MPICNICQCEDFLEFSGRSAAQCSSCQSLERHRLVYVVLSDLGFVDSKKCLGLKRALHLAPEIMTYKYLAPVFGAGYVTSDMYPEKYPYSQSLRLALPDGFNVFPDNYFDLILHNHVLEHIPGCFKEHIDEFTRILKIGGSMVFTIPGVRQDIDSIEGGENLPSDEERLKYHGQRDHYKTFGKDLYQHMDSKNGLFNEASIFEEIRNSISAPKDIVYVFTKYS